ncbi:MAG: ABC transporter ATP-binding protein [Clostridiaceae bacterium]|nr:ABC transporter ATP-binding protein [Clostridiaceae bacterium]
MAVNVSISIENSSGLLVEGLSKAWGAKQVFSGISFFQAAGTIFGIEGDNGAGKSTLLKILASVLSRDKGEVDFQGASLDNLSQWRSLIGYVPQELALDERLTVKENIRFWAALRGLEQREIRQIMLIAAEDRLVADFIDKPIKECSGGMARRASLVVGLLTSPQLLLLDEPFSGADQDSRLLMQKRLDFLRSQGSTILIASHDQDILKQICDHTLRLRQGKIVA